MKVLLIRPISNTYIITPPLGLGYIATAARKAGATPYILDCAKDDLQQKDIENFVREFEPDVVGFQVWSMDVPSVQESLEIVKKINPEITTVLGGAHISGDPKEALDFFVKADYGFKGEGEEGFPLFLKRLQGEDIPIEAIPGLAWRQGEEVIVNHASLPADIDEVCGYPAWDLMDPNTYPRAPHQGFAKAFPNAPIIATRGCPFKCTFCATNALNGRTVRFRSVKHIIEEIRLLKEEYGVKEIHIEDDNFTVNKKFVREFCQEMLDQEMNIFWYNSSGTRLDSLTPEILDLMQKAGCYTFTVAIESGSQRVLDLMKKHLKLETVRKQIKMMNDCGVKPTGLFMIGFPGETREEAYETVKFAKELDLKRAQFAIFHPLPGSDIYEELREKGLLSADDIDWGEIRPSGAAFAIGEMSKKELKSLQRRAFLEFHLRPRVLWSQLREVDSFGHMWFLAKRVAAMLF